MKLPFISDEDYVYSRLCLPVFICPRCRKREGVKQTGVLTWRDFRPQMGQYQFAEVAIKCDSCELEWHEKVSPAGFEPFEDREGLRKKEWDAAGIDFHWASNKSYAWERHCRTIHVCPRCHDRFGLDVLTELSWRGQEGEKPGPYLEAVVDLYCAKECGLVWREILKPTAYSIITPGVCRFIRPERYAVPLTLPTNQTQYNFPTLPNKLLGKAG